MEMLRTVPPDLLLRIQGVRMEGYTFAGFGEKRAFRGRHPVAWFHYRRGQYQGSFMFNVANLSSDDTTARLHSKLTSARHDQVNKKFDVEGTVAQASDSLFHLVAGRLVPKLASLEGLPETEEGRAGEPRRRRTRGSRPRTTRMRRRRRRS